MDGRFSGLKPKRPLMGAEDNGHRAKRFQASEAEKGDISFKILCPEAKAGGVIGKGGSIISQIRRETGARISVQETVEGCEERVVVVSGPAEGDQHSGFYGSVERLSPAQDALLRVHAKIAEDMAAEKDSNGVVITRMIVPNNQVGCLMGKGGKIIQQMRDESKAQIRILPRDQNPKCADPTDEILQIQGSLNVVKKALWLVSMRLKDNTSKEATQAPAITSSVYSSDYNATSRDAFMPYQNSTDYLRNLDGHAPTMISSLGFNRGLDSALGHPSSGYTYPEGGRTLGSDQGPSSSGEELVFRVLCPNKKIGGVIGKGGTIIRRLREEIGVKIKVTDSVPGSDDRIIIISSNESPDDNLSPAQEALLHIQSQIVDLTSDSDSVITTRLLVPANQVGCLIGKGGSIISEMRRATGANIRILPRKDLPQCALETDELVQISGDIRVAREALIQVTSRLCANLHPDRSTSDVLPSSSFGSLATLSGRGRPEPVSPTRSYPSSMMFQGGHSSSSYLTLPTSPGPWSSKSKHEVGSMGNYMDYEEPVVRKGGSSVFGRSTSGLITKTTVEVVVPQHVIASLLGKSGTGLSQIRQISGAKVNLLDVRPGSSEGVVEISGTPEQTHAAQCLIEAAGINKKPLFG